MAARLDGGHLPFRPTLWPTVLTLVGLALLVGLGTWQLERRAEKAELIRRVEDRLAAPAVPLPATIAEPAAWEYRRVSLTGRFRHDREMPLQVRTHRGQVGYEIVTPLVRADGGGVVLVNRGWVPADRLAPASRDAGQVPGVVTVEGIARVWRRPGWLQPDNDPAANSWFWIDPAAMADAAGVGRAAPVTVDAADQAPGGLPLGGRTRVAFPNDHLQYALTWYGLALGLAIIYVVYHWRRDPGQSR